MLAVGTAGGWQLGPHEERQAEEERVFAAATTTRPISLPSAQRNVIVGCPQKKTLRLLTEPQDYWYNVHLFPPGTDVDGCRKLNNRMSVKADGAKKRAAWSVVAVCAESGLMLGVVVRQC